MKKKLFLFLGVTLFLLGISTLFLYNLFPTLSINNNYDLVQGEDFEIPHSSFKFYSVEYDGVSTHLLGYKNIFEGTDELVLNKDKGQITSYKVGKNCILITGRILDTNTTITEAISEDVLNRVNIGLNQEKDAEIIINNNETANPYIVSKTDKLLFIDYITMIPESKSKLAYYRIIIEDVSNVSPNLTEEEISVLKDYLPELLEILNIKETIVIPK